jgi:lysyl endopeptidase
MKKRKIATTFKAGFIMVLLTGIFNSSAWGQLSVPGRPYPLFGDGFSPLKTYTLTLTRAQKSEAVKSEEGYLLKPAKSGLVVPVTYTPENSGVWDTLQDGMKVWRAAFHADGAVMMNLVFSPYQLNPGVKIFLYDGKQQHILGAFTGLNNKSINVMATGQVPGDLLVVEMQVPRYVKSPGDLAISGIGCDLSKHEDLGTKDGYYGESDVCNVDVNCDPDSLVQLEKHAVVRIVYNGGDRCTGVLLNNTRRDGINYLMTAEHCISTENEANTAVFYFDYESPTCGGLDGSTQKSLSGATIRATGVSLDFTLLELIDPVPFNYQPYYAGWNRSASPPESGFAIHHPLGDVKKVSTEEHALDVANFGYIYDAYTHWKVSHWESGTTEDGSSGCPFFNNHGYVVGTLSGGQARCESSVNDYFQMFSHCWADYSSRGRQLAYWLDPSRESVETLDGYDPYEGFRKTGDTLTNIRKGEALVLEHQDLAWGSYSGHNSSHLTGFAEKFTVSGKKKVPGFIMDVADNYVGSTASVIAIEVWKGISGPDELLYKKELPLSILTQESGNFVEFDSIVVVSGTFFAGYELSYGVPQDTFSTYMAGRTVNHVNTAYVNDGSGWQSLSDYTNGNVYSSFAVNPVVYDSIPSGTYIPQFDEAVLAYPNPAHDQINIEFRDLSAYPARVSLYNMMGELVFDDRFGPYTRVIHLDHLNLATGLYIIRIREGNRNYRLKISLIRK